MAKTTSGDNRAVSIGGNATGNLIQTGDKNRASLTFTPATLPPPESVDIKAEFTALRDILAKLQAPDQQKIERALADVHEEIGKLKPDLDEVGSALDRALKYAEKAEGFVTAAGNMKTHLTNMVAWLGSNWYKLLPLVGLTH